jgi:hypothetical protein
MTRFRVTRTRWPIIDARRNLLRTERVSIQYLEEAREEAVAARVRFDAAERALND